MPEDTTPEETNDLHEIYPITDEEATELQIVRSISQQERDSIPEDAFCGPHRSFPVRNQADVHNAASLAGHAADPSAIRACVTRKAKANGWSLPASWQDEGERAAPGEGITATADHLSPLYFPIVRALSNAQDEWIVEGQATSEALDSYNTVFDYESAKKAFARWRGNLREQHDRHKAVGKAIEWIPDDENKRILLRSRVSKGAADTWQKILDGVLTGYSVNLDPRTVKTEFIQRDGKRIPKYSDYDYLEISYVDAPGSPKCDIAIVRADGMLTDVLDATEDEEVVSLPPTEETSVSPSESEQEAIERAGARISAQTKGALHDMRDKAMSLCGCTECTGMANIPGGSSDNSDDNAAANLQERVMGIVEQTLIPVYTRLQAIAAQFARSYTPPIQQAEPIETTFQRMLSEHQIPLMTELSRMATSLDEVHAVQTAVKDQVDAIARQPVPGPIQHGAYHAADKRLASDLRQYTGTQPTQEAEIAVLQRMRDAGALDTQDKQIAAAAIAARRSNKGW